MHTIRWLGDDDCHHVGVVGGKAASLSRLASVHAVPPGFAVPGLPALHNTLPDALVPAIAHAYRALGDRCGGMAPAVAVRSSATGEDSATTSFAGMNETFTDVRGAQELIARVLDCWASLFGARACTYRATRERKPGARYPDSTSRRDTVTVIRSHGLAVLAGMAGPGVCAIGFRCNPSRPNRMVSRVSTPRA